MSWALLGFTSVLRLLLSRNYMKLASPEAAGIALVFPDVFLARYYMTRSQLNFGAKWFGMPGWPGEDDYMKNVKLGWHLDTGIPAFRAGPPHAIRQSVMIKYYFFSLNVFSIKRYMNFQNLEVTVVYFRCFSVQFS